MVIEPAAKSGDTKDTKPSGNGEGEAALKVVQTELDKVKTELTTANTAKGDVDRRLSEVSEALSDPKYLAFLAKEAEGEHKDEEGKDTTNLEEMSTKQLAEHILGKVGKSIDDLGNSVNEKFKSFAGAMSLDKMKSRVDAVVKVHPDFWDYKDAMHKISLAVPDIDPEIAYQAAKMKALEDKATKEKEDVDNASGGKGGDPVEVLQQKKEGFTAQEAVDAAFKKSFDDKKE